MTLVLYAFVAELEFLGMCDAALQTLSVNTVA